MDQDNLQNSEFVVTARKWRPLKFDDVIGQQHITKTLKNAIASGRVHHAFLFSGPRGVGKTTTARILARALNCSDPVDNEPCNKCESCLSILENRSLDVIEIDGASNNSVDDIRKLRENARYAPSGGKYKLYVIDEVHMLSNSAFNALLKILEEPPKHLIFVFATTEAHKVLPTIISRCQRFDFRRMEIEEITGLLRHISSEENINIDEESLLTIAKKADGSMRDGQSLYDQVVAFCGFDIKYSEMAEALNLIDQDFYFRICNAALGNDISAMLEITKEVISKGYDLQECLLGLTEHLRNLLTVVVTGDTSLITSSADYLGEFRKQAEKFSKAELLRLMNITSNAETNLKFAPQPGIRFEMTLIKLASLDKTIEIEELLKEIRSLKDNPPVKQIIATEKSSEKEAETGKPIFSEQKNIYNGTRKSDQPVQQSADEKNLSAKNKIPDVKSKILTKSTHSKEIEKTWNEFIKIQTESKTGIATIIQSVPEFERDEVTLYADTNFVYDNIKKNRIKLSDSLKEFYGREIGIKIKKVDKLPDIIHSPEELMSQKESNKENSSEDDKQSETKSSSSDNDGGKHPVEAKLEKLFGARELPIDEK